MDLLHQSGGYLLSEIVGWVNVMLRYLQESSNVDPIVEIMEAIHSRGIYQNQSSGPRFAYSISILGKMQMTPSIQFISYYSLAGPQGI